MDHILTGYLGELKIGKKQTCKNLSMFPLLSSHAAAVDCLLLDEALAKNLIEVSEIDEGGSVPELKVINKADRMVLLLDGEELVGAKQNRILNTTILIAARSTVTIPVSCVEQGRWSYKSARFASLRHVMSPFMRAEKADQVSCSLRATGTYASNQSAIWDEIEQKAERMNASSPSMAMSHIYEKERGSIEEYRKSFRVNDYQVGAVFMINGQIVGLDSFGRPEIFTKTFEKLIDSYALDAIDWFDPRHKITVRQAAAAAFLESVRSARTERHRPVALGSDVRLESDTITGFALTLDDDLLHLSAFARRRDRRDRHKPVSRIERFSRRRRNRA